MCMCIEQGVLSTEPGLLLGTEAPDTTPDSLGFSLLVRACIFLLT